MLHNIKTKQIFLSLFTILCIGLTTRLEAQFSENNAIYFSSELNIGNYVGVDLNLNYVYSETYSLQMGFTKSVRTSRTQPDDYSPGLAGIFLFGLINPYDEVQTYHLSVGKIYRLNNRRTIRVNFLAGLGYTVLKNPVNWQLQDSGGVGSNYSWDVDKTNVLSIIINPKIEFPLGRISGTSISPMLQFNKEQVYVGIGIGSIFGLLRP